MRASQFVFSYVQLLNYKCYKININREGSNVDSPDGIKYKKATINPINKRDKYLQFALNYEDIKKDPQRITKIEPFLNKYNWG